MSRTDSTRPWWVRMADVPMVTCFPVHDHRFGPCSLPEEITASTGWPARRKGVCYWATTYDRIGRIDGAAEWARMKREDRRRDRHQARAQVHSHRPED